MTDNIINKRSSENYEAVIIPADSIKGIHIPFVSFAPKDNYDDVPLFLFSNADGAVFDEVIDNTVKTVFNMAESLHFRGPAVVPILPSKSQFDQVLADAGIDFEVGDSKLLCRECFSSNIPGNCAFYRLDRQIDRIIERTGISDKFVGFGYSGTGVAVMRYAMISPEHFSKLVIGGNIDCVPVVAGNNARLFDYPLGMRDRDILFGKRYHKSLCHGINYEFYLSKIVGYGNSGLICSKNYQNGGSGWMVCPSDIARSYCSHYGEDMMERFGGVMSDYDAAFLNTHLKLYDGESYQFITKDDFQRIVYNNESFDAFPYRQIREFLV